MTDMELLDILGGMKGKYILEAQKMREGRPDSDIGDFPEHRTRRGGR